MVVVFVCVFMPYVRRTLYPKERFAAGRVVLVKPDGDFLFYRLALYWNVDRHFFGLPFFFVLFFHCDTELTATRTRVVNVVSCPIDRFLGQYA